MRSSKLKITAMALAIAAAMPQPANAASGDEEPAPSLTESFEQATGLKLFGYLQAGWSSNNVSTHDEATAGHSNVPVVGASDEGLQLNALHFALERPVRSNIIPRATPLPGPVPWEFSWGLRAQLLYGRNGLPAAMIGFEDNWGINRTPAGTVPGTNRQNYVAISQLYGEMYFPVAQGVHLMVGRFGSPVGREIPPEFRPNPNFFYTKTYALVSQPDQLAGALLAANLMRGEYGLLEGELGVVNGRQNWKDNNRNKSVVGALRWRSGDMQTWVDYSFMAGNEQNDMTKVDAPQMPVARIISPRGQRRQHHSLSATLHPADRWEAVGEVLYGRQAGDGRPDTIDLLSGPGYRGGSYSGVNAELRYQWSPRVRVGVRGEVFRDPKATALFPITAVAGSFNAVTVGLRYEPGKGVVIRPELRYDWQSGNNGVNAFGSGRASRQTTASVDLNYYF